MIYADICKEMFSNRNLMRELILKELKLRYSRPFLGFLWVFISPLLIVAIFYLIFVLFLKAKIEEAPFLLYLMTAVFTWRLFQDSLMASTTSLVDNKNLIRESAFPHYLIPVAIVLSSLVNFLPSLVIVVVTASVMLKGLPLFILFLPLVLFFHVLFITGMSIIFSVLYVRWRDLKHAVEPLMMLWFYLVPGVYSLRLVRDTLSAPLFSAYVYDPLTGLLCLYRVAILKGFYPKISGVMPFSALVIVPIAAALIVFAAGIRLFRENRSSINDHLSY